jgi:hypothetical protein
MRIRIHDQHSRADKHSVSDCHALQCGDAAATYPDIISYLDKAIGTPGCDNDRLEYAYRVAFTLAASRESLANHDTPPVSLAKNWATAQPPAVMPLNALRSAPEPLLRDGQPVGNLQQTSAARFRHQMVRFHAAARSQTTKACVNTKRIPCKVRRYWLVNGTIRKSVGPIG